MARQNVVVPQLGESISEAIILSVVGVGSYVTKDSVVAELETDKVTMEVYTGHAGVVVGLNCKVGDSVSVGDILLIVDQEATTSIDVLSKKTDPTFQANTTLMQVKDLNIHPNVEENKNDVVLNKTILHEKSIDNTLKNTSPSPSATRLAHEIGIDISKISGTGKRGQVIKTDILNSSNNSSDVITKDNNDSMLKDNTKSDILTQRVKMSKLRQTIAIRLKEAQNTAAILTTFNEIDMSMAIALRTKYKDVFEKKYHIKLGFMSLFMKAAAIVLKEIPTLNAQIENGDTIVYNNYCDMGFAVGTNVGLVVPVARKIDNMALYEIENEVARLGGMARDGKLGISDMRGATFTISNGGVYGSLLSTPIINPPQSGILGMHNIVRRPIAVGDVVEIRPMMYIALSYDHRIVDGKEAVTFLIRIKELIESPERMMLGL